MGAGLVDALGRALNPDGSLVTDLGGKPVTVGQQNGVQTLPPVGPVQSADWPPVGNALTKQTPAAPPTTTGNVFTPQHATNGLGGTTTGAVRETELADPRYEPFIQEASKETRIPPEILRGMMGVESGGDPRHFLGPMVTHDGITEQAHGPMQVMPSTFAKPGYDVAPGQGDIMDPRTNINFAAKYLNGIGRHMYGDKWDQTNRDMMMGALGFYNTGHAGAGVQYASNVYERAYGKGAKIEPHPETPQTTILTQSAQSNQLQGAAAPKPPMPGADYSDAMRKQMSMMMLASLLPAGWTFHPVEYNPMKILQGGREADIGRGVSRMGGVEGAYPRMRGVPEFESQRLGPERVPGKLGRKGPPE